MPLILALGRQKQVDLCEFEASLVPGQALKAQRNLVSKKKFQKYLSRVEYTQ